MSVFTLFAEAILRHATCRGAVKDPRASPADLKWYLLINLFGSVFLRGAEPYATNLAGLLSNDEVLGHDFVYGELLIGDLGGRTRLLADYKVMRQADLIANHEVAEFVRHHKINGLGIGWIDAHLLASAIVAGSRLWTADRPLLAVAQDLGVAYLP
jgi:predicted nucleic acid-binding protein